MSKHNEMEVRVPTFSPPDKTPIPTHHGKSRAYCNTQSEYYKNYTKTLNSKILAISKKVQVTQRKAK